jgi:hypothetical protein
LILQKKFQPFFRLALRVSTARSIGFELVSDEG